MSLFPASLLPANPTLSAELHVRPLQKDDHELGHLDVLGVLSPTPTLSTEAYNGIIAEMASRPETYYPIVVLDTRVNRVVATATLLVERKFLRGGGKVGHIEDVAVSSLAQGKGLGKVLVKTLAGLAETLGCYKVILDCSQDNIPFYEKCGFYHKEYEMVQYFGAAAKTSAHAQPTPTSTASAAPPKAANL